MRGILIIAILLLAACGPQVVCNDPYIQVGTTCCLDETNDGICDKDQDAPIEDTKFEDVIKDVPLEQPVSNPSAQKKPRALQAVDGAIQNAKDKVKSYTYITPYAKFDGATYYIKGDLVRVDLHDVLTLEPGSHVDILLFNRANQTAIGHCKKHEHICRDTTTRTYTLDYKQYWDDTPLDILKRYAGTKENLLRESGEVVDDRRATLFVFNEPAQTTSIWVDAHFGIPLKIQHEAKKDKRTYTFENMAFNTVKDNHFTEFNVKTPPIGG